MIDASRGSTVMGGGQKRIEGEARMAISRSEDVTNETTAIFAPTVGRALDYLTAGIHVHIVGPHFSGRTRLLREIGNRLSEEGRNTLRITGNPAWRDEPLGALVDAGLVKEPNPRLLGEAIAALERLVTSRKPVILCDETSNIDSRTAGALISVLRSTHVPSVTVELANVHRSSNPLSIGLAPAISLSMKTLDLNQLHELALSILGAPLGPVGIAKLSVESGGLFGLARALLVVGRESGTIVHQQEQDAYSVPDGLWCPDLMWLAERFVEGVDDELLVAAAKLGGQAPMPIENATKLLGPDVLNTLLSTGLARRTEFDNGATVGLYPGLLIDYLAREYESYWLATGWTPTSSDPGLDLTTALENQDTGLIAQQLVQEAVERVRSLRTEWETTPRPHQALPLLGALLDSSAPDDEVERVINDTQLTDETPDSALFLTWISRWLAARDRDEEALTLLHEYRADHPASDAILRSAEATTLFLRDRKVPSDLLRPAGPGDHPLGAEMITLVQIQIAIAQGKTRTALAMIDEFKPSFAYVGSRLPLLELGADGFNGGLEESAAKALSKLRAHRRLLTVDIIEAYGYFALIMLYTAGHIHEASTVLRNILSTSLTSTFRNEFHGASLSLGSLISMRDGREATARSLASQADIAASRPGPYPGMIPELTTILVGSELDHIDRSGDLWQLTANRMERGYLTSAFYIALEAAEHGPDTYDVIPLMKARMQEIESPLVETLGHYVFAAANDDIDGLTDAVTAFKKFDAYLFATKASITLALAYRRQGDLHQALEQANTAWRNAVEAGHEGPGLFERLRADIGLSEREREITRYVAQGMSYASIASLLDLSVRTVETHLLNITRKVGATGRKELVDAAKTWLRTTST